jgi:hypothetical protein
MNQQLPTHEHSEIFAALRAERNFENDTDMANFIASEAHAFAGQRVDAWRRRTTQDATAVDAQLAITEIVGEDEDDLGFLS